MGSFNQGFDSLDLEIIDRVYETAWAQLEAREPFRDRIRTANEGRSYASAPLPSPPPARLTSTVFARGFWRICPNIRCRGQKAPRLAPDNQINLLLGGNGERHSPAVVPRATTSSLVQSPSLRLLFGNANQLRSHREPLAPTQRLQTKSVRESAMEPNDSFERFRHAQIGEEIHQPLIFAILVILISITLYFIF